MIRKVMKERVTKNKIPLAIRMYLSMFLDVPLGIEVLGASGGGRGSDWCD